MRGKTDWLFEVKEFQADRRASAKRGPGAGAHALCEPGWQEASRSPETKAIMRSQTEEAAGTQIP